MKILKFLPAVLILFAFTFPAREMKMEYVFTLGDQYQWTQSSAQTIKQSIPGMGDVTIDIKMEGEMKFKVVEKTATGGRLEIQYTKLKMNTKTSLGQGDNSMDSEVVDGSLQNKMVKAMMGKTFYFRLSRLGVVEGIEGSDNLYSGFDSLGLDSATMASAKQSFQQTLGDKSLKASLEMALIAYPETKLKVGDTWKSTGNLAMNFPVQIDNTWNFKSLENTLAVIGSDGVLTTTDKEKSVLLPNGFRSKFDLSGRQASSGKADVKTGWPQELKIVSEIKGNMTLLAGGMIPDDMLVPMEIESESTYTIVKK